MGRSLKLNIITVMMLAGVSLGQAAVQRQPKQVLHVTKSACAKAKLALRILDDARESFSVSKYGDGEIFDPFTRGLLDGLEKDNEDDQSNSRLSKGDRELAWTV